MTGYEFGDIVLVPFPFTDQSTTKRRPAVVVSSESYHRDRPDVIILAVTSQVRAAPMVGDAAIGGWKEAGLLKPSSLKPLIATVEKGLIHRKLGRLDEEDRQVLRGMLDAILGG
ncbi:MAG: type II toxin-antitoxin system PemK/MazF family toxin [Planctomycetota bacterium]|jgi:mRNA interferase MazF